ncbi:MAG: flagellum-specific ATP synthase FliI [Bdellovibrionaceae bacterium]|nr:flagellum-specific ATP synthase FliI [Pseudobdellovibrionaceae bacterium]
MNYKEINKRLSQALIYKEAGKITKVVGLLYEAYLPGAAVGSRCRVYPSGEVSSESIEAEVVGFKDNRVLLMPFREIQGVNTDSLVVLKQRSSSVNVSSSLLGRVIDATGRPLDFKGPIVHESKEMEARNLYQPTLNPVTRTLIREPLDLGVRAINSLLTCGKGQRVGIMAGSGVGKSVLLGMMAKNTAADINVIALIGERGREVREFIENELGEEGMKRSVVVVATSDQSPLVRMRGAFLATSIAEYFRDRDKSVLLLMDSVTRFCMAQREIGLSMGEPPASKGYTPSVFSTLPKLLERAGTNSGKGSITGLYTVLVEGDDMDDPIADSARSILDGHIVLTRKLAQKNHFPAIDVLSSASRVMNSVISEEHAQLAAKIREWKSIYESSEDLINIGAYVKGTNAEIDKAILVKDKITKMLRQGINEKSTLTDSIASMRSIQRFAEAHSADSGGEMSAVNSYDNPDSAYI